MSSKEKEQHKEERDEIVCPVGRFFMEFCFNKNSKFFEHLNRSKLELLKAIRSLIDEKIENLEKAGSSKKRVTKIEVE